MYDLCSDELQRALRTNRDVADRAFQAELSLKRAKTSAECTPATSGSSSSVSAGTAAAAVPAPAVAAAAASAEEDAMDEEEALALAQAMQMSMGGEGEQQQAVDSAAATAAATSGEKSATMETADTTNNDSNSAAPAVSTGPVSVGLGLPEGFTGQYELHAVVTHKGRSADSGHYIGWARQTPGSDFWWCYDDDKVTEVRTEDIMKLGGGGDRDMAYLNFYRFRDMKK